MICPSCNAELEKVGKFCPYCGERLTDMVHDEKEPKEMYHDEIVEDTKINDSVNNDSRLEEDSFSTNIVEVQEIEVESNGKKEIVQIQWEQLDGYMFDPKNIKELARRNDEVLILTKDYSLFYSTNGYEWERLTTYPEEIEIIDSIGCQNGFFMIQAKGSKNFYYSENLINWNFVVDDSDADEAYMPFMVNNIWFKRHFTKKNYTWNKSGFFSSKTITDTTYKMDFYISDNIGGPYKKWKKSEEIPLGVVLTNPTYFKGMYFAKPKKIGDYKGIVGNSVFYDNALCYCTDRTPWSKVDNTLLHQHVAFNDSIGVSIENDYKFCISLSKNGTTWKESNVINEHCDYKIWRIAFISDILFILECSNNGNCYISLNMKNFYKLKMHICNNENLIFHDGVFFGVFKKNSSQDDLILLRGKVNRRDATLLDDIEGYTKKIWGGLVDALKK